jgi:hypothetical protein
MDYGNQGTSFMVSRREAGMVENLPDRVPDSAVLRYTSCATRNQVCSEGSCSLIGPSALSDLRAFQDQWVVARFSPHVELEYMMALGDENGKVTIGHAEHSHNAEMFKLQCESLPAAARPAVPDARALSAFEADQRGSVIMDLGFLDGRPNALVTLSGGGEVLLWDLHQPSAGAVQCIGHDTCARSFSSWPANPSE